MEGTREHLTRKKVRNIGSLGVIIYAIPHDEVETFPALPAEDANMIDAAKLVGNLVPKSTSQGWMKIRATMDTPGIIGTKQGETDGKSRVQTLKFHIAALDDLNLGFEAKSMNQDWVFCATDPNRPNQRFMVGTKVFGAVADDDGDSGTQQETAGRAGIDYSFKSVGFASAYLYEPTDSQYLPENQLLDESGS